tara:strand:+ start:790 stop:984 length:195 start_codon:yes stop_codon:yes gene_type:complete
LSGLWLILARCIQNARRNFRGGADIGLDDDTLKALKGRHQALSMFLSMMVSMNVVPFTGPILAE